VSTVRVIGRI